MGRFEILKTKQITEPKINFTEEVDKNILMSIDSIAFKIGQYKSILVCEQNGKKLIVDGHKHFKSLKRNKVKKILCYNLGELKKGEYEFYRLVLNIHQSRLNYLGIAEVVAWLKSQDFNINTISNKTGLDVQTVERYSTLLQFDWDEFNKKQFNPQFNPFEDER